MDFQKLWQMGQEKVMERYRLAVREIRTFSRGRVQEPFCSFFIQMAQFIAQMDELFLKQINGEFLELSQKELKDHNHRLYLDILPGYYEESYANPTCAARRLGTGYGPLFSAFYVQLRGMIVFAYEGRWTDMTALAETLVELYHMFDRETPDVLSVREFLCQWNREYLAVALPYRIQEQIDPGLSFAKDIILKSDLSDLRYLYQFGEYISDSELETADFLNRQPQEVIEKMARTYTEGYRRGFEVMRRDLSRKKTVSIRYVLGFERMIRAAVFQFRKMGLEPVIYRAAVWPTLQAADRKSGYHGTSPNRQYDYDHRYDHALYFDESFQKRKLDTLREAYEKYRDFAWQYAGPAVVETFGEEGFSPVNKPEAWKLSKEQEEDAIAYARESMAIVNRYIPGDETSFTMIAFPVPAVGEDYEAIFQETIKINTLDSRYYQTIQQKIIDVLDEAEYVHVTGRGGNQTNIVVRLHPLSDRQTQTNFENCVADVNIPVGEVFTSPMLAGTHGCLHVQKVYLGGILYQDLRFIFQDGRVAGYSCGNFADPEEGRALIRQEILKNHDSLPLGEFAIGTNTTAYMMAKTYGIADKLPILIAEKMGPHFAVGDTCYSWSEDSPMYNPDGKEVIARENEISILRKKDVSKAYFGCHTDITIPYSELGDIYAVTAKGEKIPVILDGQFSVAGSEELNEPLHKRS